MQNNEIEEMALTNEIVCRLIYEFGISSLVKIIFICFSIKNMQLYFSPSSKKYGLINEVYDAISFGLQNNFYDFKHIFSCIEILERNKYIEICTGKIKKLKTPIISKENNILNSQIFSKMVLDVTKLSDLSFVKGVIGNV